jgi:hypothetical protein
MGGSKALLVRLVVSNRKVTPMPRPFRFALVVCVLALLAAACGGDDGAAATTSTEAAATTSTQAAATTSSTTKAPASSDETASGPITIEMTLKTLIDYSTHPFEGTFEVTEGADILGCSVGVWVDGEQRRRSDDVLDGVPKLMTCARGDRGTFTIIFVPGGYDTGPGDNNGPWSIVDATADFTGLQGDGDWWAVGEAETLAGDIEFTS